LRYLPSLWRSAFPLVRRVRSDSTRRDDPLPFLKEHVLDEQMDGDQTDGESSGRKDEAPKEEPEPDGQPSPERTKVPADDAYPLVAQLKSSGAGADRSRLPVNQRRGGAEDESDHARGEADGLRACARRNLSQDGTRHRAAILDRGEEAMLEVEKTDSMVAAAYRRVQELDRFSRLSTPIGKADLATIALQALAELGALADWTVRPGTTDSIVQLLNEKERDEYESFQEFVRKAGEEATSRAERSASARTVSEPAEMEIDPAPASHSRKASLDEVLADEDLAAGAAEAIVYQLYADLVDRATILLERSEAARRRLWPLVWVVATLIPPPDLSLRDRDGDGAPDGAAK